MPHFSGNKLPETKDSKEHNFIRYYTARFARNGLHLKGAIPNVGQHFSTSRCSWRLHSRPLPNLLRLRKRYDLCGGLRCLCFSSATFVESALQNLSRHSSHSSWLPQELWWRCYGQVLNGLQIECNVLCTMCAGCVSVPQAVKNVMVPCQSSLPLLVGHEHTRDTHEIHGIFEVLQLYTGLYINSLDHVWLGKNIVRVRIGLWSFRVNFWFLHAQVPIEPKAPPTCRERGREWLQEWVSNPLKKSWPGMDWHRGPHHLKEATSWSIGGRASKASKA